LTKKGREYLAKNNGEFNIQRFSLGDDEVDYNIIKQYGRTIGKEKIEKNTPVMEAATDNTSPIKYPLITVSEPIIFFPSISPTSPADFKASEVLEIGVAGSTTFETTASLTFKISTSGNRVTANSFASNVYRIEMDSRLLRITRGGAAEFTDSFDKRTFYIAKSTAAGGALNNSNLSFTLGVTDNINTSTTEFSKYQVSGDTFIRTFVRVSSNQTGISKIFEVKIYASTT
jgi:uncharacterized protein YaaQ